MMDEETAKLMQNTGTQFAYSPSMTMRMPSHCLQVHFRKKNTSD